MGTFDKRHKTIISVFVIFIGEHHGPLGEKGKGSALTV